MAQSRNETKSVGTSPRAGADAIVQTVLEVLATSIRQSSKRIANGRLG